MVDNAASIEADVTTINTTCHGVLFVMVGPSGTGKNEIMRQVMTRLGKLGQLATATTRAMRPSEQHGREHFFVTRPEFDTLIKQGDLVEYQEVYPGTFYGTLRKVAQQAFDDHRLL